MIDEKLKTTPHKPGCYLMKDKNGYIIYVGKSKNLKNRLSSYFKSSHVGKTAMLVKDIYDFEYILTSSEVESLLLEINLIKKYTPKYNILYKDDKSYPYIELTNDKYPRLLIVRQINPKRGKNRCLFGPYPNVYAAKKTVEILNRIYPLRKCKNLPKKECLYYHINECMGYCTNKVSLEEIDKMRGEIISFFNGNSTIVRNKLEEKMYKHSSLLEFEKAKYYKDLLDYIDITLEKQKVDGIDNYNRDVIGYYTDNYYLSINILFIRGGKLIDKKSNIFPMIDTLDNEIETYISNFYIENPSKVKEVLTPSIVNNELLTETFSFPFITPSRGVKKKLLDLAYENASVYYNEQITILENDEDKRKNTLNELAKVLNIPKVDRIELFDNSNLFGNFNVSGMVVFIGGKKAPQEYRKYKISVDKNDDYNTMKEVIYRRYFRVLKDDLVRPDLIIVDGGVNQINACKDIISSLGLDIPICGLKKDNHHSTNTLITEDLKEIDLKKDSDLFLFLTKMQDEVHRYTISYHKQIRSKGALSSILDNIPGIGEVRKKKILKKYKTISAIKDASISELEEILPHDVAKNFYDYIRKEDV